MSSEREEQERLLRFAKHMRHAPSDAEQKLWQSLRRKQLDGLKFKRQVPIPPFIADFVCDECSLIVEVDGFQHDAAQEYDHKRTEFLHSIGWRVIRFSAREVVQKLNAVLDTILRECRPSP